MATLKLKTKGQEAYVSVKQLVTTLKWTAPVDLDLMAFYKTKDGKVGGIFSDNYAGGSMGSLNSFPFIQLSGDEGVGATGGENEEVLRITKLDDMAELYICTINFTDASQGQVSRFNKYDAQVVVVDDKGESVTVPLDSSLTGTVAVIAKIDNSGIMGAKLINENRIMDMAEFQSIVPGANLLNLSSKIVLKKKGESVTLKPKTGGKAGEILVNLNWNQKPQQQKSGGFLSKILSGGAAIDLDLGCLFELTNGIKAVVQPLGNAFGSYNAIPYIFHTGDDRTGAQAEGENMRINGGKISEFRRILIYSYIYEGAANWSQADGVITIKQAGSPDIVVHLDNTRNGVSVCAIALFENVNNAFKVTKIVQYFQGHPDMDRAYNWGLRWVAGSKD